MKDMRWGIRQRLKFIEFRLFWEGFLNRADIVNVFGVSKPQASKDLAQYQAVAADNMEYNPQNKAYIATKSFEPIFFKPDPNAYLKQLGLMGAEEDDILNPWIKNAPESDSVPILNRDIDDNVMRKVLEAIRNNKSIEIYYQSMNVKKPEPIWRWITPHAFGFDGLRWHSRSFCHTDNIFKDFTLPRMLETREIGEPGATGAIDWYWNNYFEIIIEPNPKLIAGQRATMIKDYGLGDGNKAIRVRYAMLRYSLIKLNLLNYEEDGDPGRWPIILKNRDEVVDVMERLKIFR